MNGPTPSNLTSTTHSVLTLTCKCTNTLKKIEVGEEEKVKKNKYLICFLKKRKLALCNTSLGAEINDEANGASL